MCLAKVGHVAPICYANGLIFRKGRALMCFTKENSKTIHISKYAASSTLHTFVAKLANRETHPLLQRKQVLLESCLHPTKALLNVLAGQIGPAKSIYFMI